MKTTTIIHQNKKNPEQILLKTDVELKEDNGSKSLVFLKTQDQKEWQEYSKQRTEFLDIEDQGINRAAIRGVIKEQIEIFSSATHAYSAEISDFKIEVAETIIKFMGNIDDLKDQLDLFIAHLDKLLKRLLDSGKRNKELKEEGLNKELNKKLKKLVSTKFIKKLIDSDDIDSFIKIQDPKKNILNLDGKIDQLITDMLYKFFWQYSDFIRRQTSQDYQNLFTQVIRLYIENYIEKERCILDGEDQKQENLTFKGTKFPNLSHELLYWLPYLAKQYSENPSSQILHKFLKNFEFEDHEIKLLSYIRNSFIICYQQIESKKDDKIIAFVEIMSAKGSKLTKDDPRYLLTNGRKDGLSEIVSSSSDIESIQKDLTESKHILFPMIEYVIKYHNFLLIKKAIPLQETTSSKPEKISEITDQKDKRLPITSYSIKRVKNFDLPSSLAVIDIDEVDHLTSAGKATLRGSVEIALAPPLMRVKKAKRVEDYDEVATGSSVKVTIPSTSIPDSTEIKDNKPLSTTIDSLLKLSSIAASSESPKHILEGTAASLVTTSTSNSY